MSMEARARAVIEEAVREATEPLKRELEALSARLAALEDGGGRPAAQAPKRGAAGRTGRGKTQPADDAPAQGEGLADGVPAQRKGGDE